MLYHLSRFLQLVGLVLPIIAISGNIANEDLIKLKVSLTISGIGVAIFFVGWLIQQKALAKMSQESKVRAKRARNVRSGLAW